MEKYFSQPREAKMADTRPEISYQVQLHAPTAHLTTHLTTHLITYLIALLTLARLARL